MSQEIFFTSDTHFGHRGILKYSNRLFASVQDMDEELIKNWNEAVRPSDIVWHLGDFAWTDPLGYWARLNGQKSIVFGNHDDKHRKRLMGVANWAGDVKYLRTWGQRIFLSHYAHRTWRSSNHGSFHLYGHSHGDLPGYRRSMDVGVDAHALRPVSLGEVIAVLEAKPINDHHERMSYV